MKLNLYALILLWFADSVAGSLAAQPATYTNSIGMQFVFIKPGGFVLGKFQPPYPKPGNESSKEYTEQEYKFADRQHFTKQTACTTWF